MYTKMQLITFAVFFVFGMLLSSFVRAEYTVLAPLNREVSQQKFLSYYQPRRVDITWLSDSRDFAASYAYNTCLNHNPGWKNGVNYTCKAMIETFTSENMQWDMFAEGKNNNGSSDWGICQLNSTYHFDFIISNGFHYPMSQIDYCVNERLKGYYGGHMRFYGYRVRHQRIREGSIVFRR